MNFKIIYTIIFLLFSTYLSANENNQSTLSDSNISKDAIFNLNGKIYKLQDFPKEYQELSKEQAEKFISQYIYYTLLLESLEKEIKEYQPNIKKAIEARDKEFKKKGLTLSKINQTILNKKIIVDTISYNLILKKHKEIEKEVKEFYNKHKSGYNFPNRAEISHIVVKDENLSKELIKKLQKSNNNLELFAKLAKKHSIHHSSKNNAGYVGEISEKSVGKDFFTTIWNAKENTLLEKALKKKEYFHIIYIFNKYKAEQKELKTEKEAIQKYLLKKEIKKWELKRILKLKKESKVIFYKK